MRRRRRSYGPLTHSDVGRKSNAWSPVTPLISIPTSFSGAQGTACPQHPTLCPGPSEPRQCSSLRERTTLSRTVSSKEIHPGAVSYRSIARVGAALMAAVMSHPGRL